MTSPRVLIVVPTLGRRLGYLAQTLASIAAQRDEPADVVVVAPCGYDRDGAAALADELTASGVLPAGLPVHPVDANASWARPGTRLVDGVEELARLLHP